MRKPSLACVASAVALAFAGSAFGAVATVSTGRPTAPTTGTTTTTVSNAQLNTTAPAPKPGTSTSAPAPTTSRTPPTFDTTGDAGMATGKPVDTSANNPGAATAPPTNTGGTTTSGATTTPGTTTGNPVGARVVLEQNTVVEGVTTNGERVGGVTVATPVGAATYPLGVGGAEVAPSAGVAFASSVETPIATVELDQAVRQEARKRRHVPRNKQLLNSIAPRTNVDRTDQMPDDPISPALRTPNTGPIIRY